MHIFLAGVSEIIEWAAGRGDGLLFAISSKRGSFSAARTLLRVSQREIAAGL
ncbi:MAG TPA: hypothetical protein VJJ55_02440 [Candidatus Paceibacterota bacterium]